MVLGTGTFQLTDSISFDDVSHWQLRREDLKTLWANGLSRVPELIMEEGLNSYKKAVRTSLLVYGSGTTFPTRGDRLIHTIAALESILVKHGMEATEANVEERVAALVPISTQDEAALIVRAGYRLRSRYDNASFNEYEGQTFQKFVQIAHGVITLALSHIDNFSSLSNFIDVIDRKRFPEGSASSV